MSDHKMGVQDHMVYLRIMRDWKQAYRLLKEANERLLFDSSGTGLLIAKFIEYLEDKDA